MSKTTSYIIAGLAGILILALAVVFILVLNQLSSSADEEAPTLVSTAVAVGPTIAAPTELPPPAVEVPSTFTPLPTSTPTDTPVATTPTVTNTPLPTNTFPPPTATNTPVPVIPTNPPPTATPANTATPAPPANDTRGLVATNFSLQPRSNFGVNQQIWFEFTLVNTTGGNVPYNRLGVMPRKNGADRRDLFKQSWGGPNASIKPDGLVHEDNIRLPEAGNYTLRLAVCFEDWEGCNGSGGNWATLSQEIIITVN